MNQRHITLELFSACTVTLLLLVAASNVFSKLQLKGVLSCIGEASLA